jgi:hypothetical protein
VNANDCTAVGYRSGNQSLVEVWNGVTWQIVTSPNLSGYTVLTSVSCTGSSDCTAVGYWYNGSTPQTLARQAGH